MNAWKSVALGALGALTVCIPFAVAIFVLDARPRTTAPPAGADRAALLRQIDEYQNWTDYHGGLYMIGYDLYRAERWKFLSERPALAEYYLWVAMRRLGGDAYSFVPQEHPDNVSAALLRDRHFLDPYLARR